MNTELLAPAKNKEIAMAAIDCGADAVYIGASSFGARQNASNSIDDIAVVVNYAHKYWVKVFVTVNTILTDSELDEAISLVCMLDKIGVDAIIVQDMGLIKKLNELNIQIPIHISTQCDNRSLEKIKFFNDLGVQRVVLARELSIDNVRRIHAENPDLELEAFVHGALCVSYSGQCYLSRYIGGRSANRGECAQPCRRKYSVISNNGNVLKEGIYALCMKDFNASNHLKDMVDAGVYSYKIEGRLKDVGYVKNITAYYRNELDKYSEKTSSGRSVYQFIPNPEKSFNRGFTDYFLKERGECHNFKSPKSQGEYIGKVIKVFENSFLVNTDKDIHSQDGLCFYSNNDMVGLLVNKAETSKNGVIVYPNKMSLIKAGQEIFRNFDSEFEKLLLKPVKRQIGVSVEYKNGIITLIDEDGINTDYKIESSELAQNAQKMYENFLKQFSKTGESDFYIKDIKISDNLPFLPISSINQIRREMFDTLMQNRLKSYKRFTQKTLKYTKFPVEQLDYRANIHNMEAKAFYEKCGCDVKEMSLESKLPARQVELMRTKYCLKYALNMCKSTQNLSLKDESGKIFPLKFDCSKCEMAVLSPMPMS